MLVASYDKARRITDAESQVPGISNLLPYTVEPGIQWLPLGSSMDAACIDNYEIVLKMLHLTIHGHVKVSGLFFKAYRV